MAQTFIAKMVVEIQEEDNVRIPLAGQLATLSRFNWSASEIGQDAQGNEWALVDVAAPDSAIGQLARAPDSIHLGRALTAAQIVDAVRQRISIDVGLTVAEHTGRTESRQRS